MEKLIPITARQHEHLKAAAQAVEDAKQRHSLVFTTLALGLNEELPSQASYVTREKDGVYSLVITIPDPPPEG